jgi:hypothetical protein
MSRSTMRLSKGSGPNGPIRVAHYLLPRRIKVNNTAIFTQNSLEHKWVKRERGKKREG